MLPSRVALRLEGVMHGSEVRGPSQSGSCTEQAHLSRLYNPVGPRGAGNQRGRDCDENEQLVTVPPVYRPSSPPLRATASLPVSRTRVPPVYAPGVIRARPVVQRTEVTATNPVGTLPVGARVSEHHKLVLMAQGSQNLHDAELNQEANDKLKKSGEHESFVRLTAGTTTIQVPDPKRAGQQKTLHEVIPEWVRSRASYAFDKAAIANQPGGTAPTGYGSSAVALTSGPGVAIAMNAECGAAASPHGYVEQPQACLQGRPGQTERAFVSPREFRDRGRARDEQGALAIHATQSQFPLSRRRRALYDGDVWTADPHQADGRQSLSRHAPPDDIQ